MGRCPSKPPCSCQARQPAHRPLALHQPFPALKMAAIANGQWGVQVAGAQAQGYRKKCNLEPVSCGLCLELCSVRPRPCQAVCFSSTSPLERASFTRHSADATLLPLPPHRDPPLQLPSASEPTRSALRHPGQGRANTTYCHASLSGQPRPQPETAWRSTCACASSNKLADLPCAIDWSLLVA